MVGRRYIISNQSDKRYVVLFMGLSHARGQFIPSERRARIDNHQWACVYRSCHAAHVTVS